MLGAVVAIRNPAPTAVGTKPLTAWIESWHGRCWRIITKAMTDLIFVSITIGFFAVAWLYVRACERL
jgi:hypothetical protein